MDRVATARFPGLPAAVSDAREFVRRFVEDPHLADDALLLVSELACNVVEHARTPYEVQVARRPGMLRVAVTDGSSCPARVSREPVDAPRGRGLRIVASLAARWGVEPGAGGSNGKTVWFELDAPAPTSAPAPTPGRPRRTGRRRPQGFAELTTHMAKNCEPPP